MKKIALLTIHYGESYGAVLQTYATSKILNSLGYEVLLINLLDRKYDKRFFKIRTYFSLAKLINFNLLKIINFKLFKVRNYPKFIYRSYRLKRISNFKINYCIVGSDQVWNKAITQDRSLNYFLDFLPPEIKRFSLASSFGVYNWIENDEYTKKVDKELRKFDALSVREVSGVKILSEKFHLNSEQLIDPTLAWGNYDKFISKTKEKDIITCFILNTSNPLLFTIVNSLKKEYDLNVQFLDYMASSDEYEIIENWHKSPSNWIRYIKESSVVVTDSFHGVAFSLLFEKQFYVLCANKMKFARISSLLKLVGLENRVLNSAEDLKNRIEDLKKTINYEPILKILKNERERYYQYINKNIKNK